VEQGARDARRGLGPPRVSAPALVALTLDGRAVAPDAPALTGTERGFLYGDGLFESLRIEEGIALDAAAHFARLSASAGALAFPALARARWDDAIAAALAATPWLADRALVHSLRVTWARGATRVRAYAPAPDDGPPRLVVGVYARPAVDDPAERGVTAITVTGLAPGDLARHKTLSAMAYTVAQQRARTAGADEALLVDAEGRVLEAAGANVFLVSYAEGIFTPPASRPLLPGLMRARVLGWRPDASERDFTVDALLAADEAFLTNAVLGVVPLRAIDGRPVGDRASDDLVVDLQNQWYAWRIEQRARERACLAAGPGGR